MTAAQDSRALWINPNDKTKNRWLPNIGEREKAADHIADAGKMVPAPVELPEPVARLYHDRLVLNFGPGDGPGEAALYTEQQVRALLEKRAA